MDNKSGDFDWQTDSDEGWELTANQQSRETSSRWKEWRLFFLVPFAIMLIGAATGVYLFIGQRTDRVQERFADEVIRGHNLLLQAVEENDDELFLELLSSRKISWRSLQEELLRRQLILGRTSFGLLKAPGRRADHISLDESVKLGADLKTAEVVEQVNYSIATGENLSQIVPLEMIFHYQREGASWKYIPPPDEDAFWGKWSRIEMENITIVVPQRDEDLGQLFSRDLDSLIHELCTQPEIECPPDFHLRLQLDRQPRSLLRLAEDYKGDELTLGSGQYSLVLPTPTLVGRPIDEIDNEVLYKSYAGWVAAVIITNYLIMDDEIGDTHLIDYLSKRDLQPPLAPDLILPRAAEVPPQDVNALPAQDLLMLCAADQRLNLWRYSPVQNRWLDELADVGPNVFGATQVNSEAILYRSPDVKGVLLTMHQLDNQESRWRTYLWRDRESHLLLDEDSLYFYWPSLFFSWADQSRGRLTVFGLINEDPRSDAVEALWYDIHECLDSICELRPIEGIPFWSPDGKSSIIFQGFNSDSPWLSLGDDEAMLLLDLGKGLPVGWLDANRFAYLLMAAESQDSAPSSSFDELVVATVSSQRGEIVSQETIIKTSDLSKAVFDEDRKDQLRIDSALAIDDGMSGWVIIASYPANNDNDSVSYIFRFYPDQEVANIIATHEGSTFPMVLGQRAGFMAIAWRGEDKLVFKIFDTIDGQLLWQDDTLPYDWSDDGKWLIFVEQGRLRFTGTESHQEIVIPYDLRGCYSAVWVDRDL